MNDIPTAAEIARRTATLVCERLPVAWTVAENLEPETGSARPDVAIEIETNDRHAARLVIEVKQTVERRDIASIRDQVGRMVQNPEDVPVVAARYLSPSVRDALTRAGLSYVDATGNVRIVIDSPAVFISDRGENRDPWRKGRPLGTLKGAPAARVARTLLDYRRNWRISELITVSRASSGATYRVLDYLEREDLVLKSDGRYSVPDWERLLREWSADAAFQTKNRVQTFIEPHGVGN